MSNTPPLLRLCYATFVLSILALALAGLLAIWVPPRSEVFYKLAGSLGVVAAATALVLAGYRTLHLTRRGE